MRRGYEFKLSSSKKQKGNTKEKQGAGNKGEGGEREYTVGWDTGRVSDRKICTETSARSNIRGDVLCKAC